MNTIKIEKATVGRVEEAFPTKGGKLLVKFSVADNAKKDQTRWFTVEAWNELAEQILGSVAVGDKVDLEGYLDRVESYTSKKTNKPEAKMVVVLTAIHSIEKKRAAA
ncbi:MAG: single-stranded DNA-binding protein [Candidatus Obscuribacterales bacterium]|nr:single-stranded DNA-binding protein [Candidatus Obscuribacterales bacterium]